jgi:hypothetical protein
MHGVVAAFLSVLAVSACASSAGSANAGNKDELALMASKSAMEGPGGLDATIDRAYWWLSSTGPVAAGDSNFKGRCTAPSVMHVSLIGQFPRITVLPPPGLDVGPVTQVDLLADSETGDVCVVAVRTESSEPPSRATEFTWPN